MKQDFKDGAQYVYGNTRTLYKGKKNKLKNK